jgi:hypothetical protein
MATKVNLSTDFIITFGNAINSYMDTFFLFKVDESYFIDYLSLSLSHKPNDNGPSLNIRNAGNTPKLEYPVLGPVYTRTLGKNDKIFYRKCLSFRRGRRFWGIKTHKSETTLQSGKVENAPP